MVDVLMQIHLKCFYTVQTVQCLYYKTICGIRQLQRLKNLSRVHTAIEMKDTQLQNLPRVQQIAHGRSFVKNDGSDSLFGIKRGMKNIRKLRIRIENNLLPVALLKRIMRVIHSRLLFFKERREQFPHGHSFLKSDESKSLTFAL